MAKQNYEVGHKKPPKQHQWKQGQSGNPSGRPKKVDKPKTFLEDVASELSTQVTLTDNGVKVTMSLSRALAKKILRDLMIASTRDTVRLLELLNKLRVFELQSVDLAKLDDEDDEPIFSEEDRRLLKIACSDLEIEGDIPQNWKTW